MGGSSRRKADGMERVEGYGRPPSAALSHIIRATSGDISFFPSENK